jgi:hypothetical protein
MKQPHYSPNHDLRDGGPWSEMNIDDLKASLENGRSVR